jgi:hypothetical protein
MFRTKSSVRRLLLPEQDVWRRWKPSAFWQPKTIKATSSSNIPKAAAFYVAAFLFSCHSPMPSKSLLLHKFQIVKSHGRRT